MAKREPKKTVAEAKGKTEVYEHKGKEGLLRPDIGLQAQFKKQKPPKTYKYDSSLDPAMSWDEGNPARERAEALIKQIQEAKTVEEAKAAADMLARMSKPFLNWSGKAERTEFNVPTLPLFTHERLSTQAILETLKSRKRDKQQALDLFADTELDIADRALQAYEHKAPWVNRLILGDSLAVMNSLLQYESLGGQVQMIYFDPPYGVKFGSNFQPFVRKRDVKHGDDESMTREPETVQAYRDTWEMGLHSYLTYLRDRFTLAHELLHSYGSLFVQINEDNLHHVRELLDEVFGADHCCRVIPYVTTSFQADKLLPNIVNYLLWYAKDKDHVKVNKMFRSKQLGDDEAGEYKWVLLVDGAMRSMTEEEIMGITKLPAGAKAFRYGPLTSQGYSEQGSRPFKFKGKTYSPGNNQHWKITTEGLNRLVEKGLLIARENSLAYYMFLDDFPISPITNVWTDTKWGFDAGDKAYAVQTNTKIISRCISMTTDPGDLVVDPTSGSGTTAYVAEQWGRRWITIDTSRVPLALARQRLLTATFPYFELKDPAKGPSGGFVFKRKQNKKGEEIGGIVPHKTLGSIANNEPPKEEVLVDRPEEAKGIIRVTGPFVVEATIPQPMDTTIAEEEAKAKPGEADEATDYITRMVEILRKVATIRVSGNKTVTFQKVRRPAKAMDLHAEAVVANGVEKPVAFYFGPENGAVTEAMVNRALKEANLKGFEHLYVIGFAIQANANKLIQDAGKIVMPATYVTATMDLQMTDLLKNQRASQVFAVTGMPEVKLIKLKKKSDTGEAFYKVQLLGLDVFDPVDMEHKYEDGENVPCWFIDTDYNELAFCVSQAFFPRTSAWDKLKKDLKGTYEDSVWEHLAGTESEPFMAGDSERIAVKVIDDRGNELLVVKEIKEAEAEK